MEILLAPDSFKGTLWAWEVSQVVEEGLRDSGLDCRVEKLPIADGGEGTAEVLRRAWGGIRMTSQVKGPLYERVEASWGLSPDRKTAVLDMASASGLTLVPLERRNPLLTTTYGTGELIRNAIQSGVEEILVGIGGSATVDGGLGALRALGVKLYDEQRNLLEGRGQDLLRLSAVDAEEAEAIVSSTRIVAMVDVRNPLCGPEGAARVYGPQKGASPEVVALLEEGLEKWAERIEVERGISVKNLPGAGAAGGLPAALVAYLNAEICAGAPFVLKRLQFDEKVTGKDLLITGEGMVDSKTLYGKAPYEALRRAKQKGIPVVLLAGSLGPGAEEVYRHGADLILASFYGKTPFQGTEQEARENLYFLSYSLGKSFVLGRRLPSYAQASS